MKITTDKAVYHIRGTMTETQLKKAFSDFVRDHPKTKHTLDSWLIYYGKVSSHAKITRNRTTER